MKIYEKKLIIIILFLFITILISLYFLTKEEDAEFISTDNLYISSNNENSTIETTEIIVHIAGEVVNPGLVYLPTEARIADAINSAGGTTELANISKVNLAYTLQDGQKIYIPSIYDEEEIQYIQNDAGNNVIDNSFSTQNSSLININSASQAELETLPGIGASTANKIIDYRNRNGRFQKIEDIMNVSGIGEAKFNNIKDYICIWQHIFSSFGNNVNNISFKRGFCFD